MNVAGRMAGPLMDSVLIVGGGAAGWPRVETLRSEGYAGALTMVCDEPELPYDRPPLSKQVLTGAWDPSGPAFARPPTTPTSASGWCAAGRAPSTPTAGRCT